MGARSNNERTPQEAVVVTLLEERARSLVGALSPVLATSCHDPQVLAATTQSSPNVPNGPSLNCRKFSRAGTSPWTLVVLLASPRSGAV